MLWIDAFLTSCLELQGHLRPMDAQKVMQSWLSFWHSPEHPEPVMWLNDPGPIRTRVQSGFGRFRERRFAVAGLEHVVGCCSYKWIQNLTNM